MRFSSPPNQQAYYEQVWNLVRQIPPGKVASYGQIALLISPPMGVDFDSYKAFAPRWVGAPWRPARTMYPGSASSTRRARSASAPARKGSAPCSRKRGVPFVKDKVDMKKYGWKGPGEADEPDRRHCFKFTPAIT